MNWEAVGAVGELFGGVAIVVSFIYRALQIRQNTDQIRQAEFAARQSAYAQVSQSAVALRHLFISAPEVSKLLLAGLNDRRNLAIEDRFRFDRLLEDLFFSFQASFVSFHAASLDPEAWRAQESVLTELSSQLSVQHWWRSHREQFYCDFASYIEERLPAMSAA